jgi:hypothetical protein
LLSDRLGTVEKHIAALAVVRPETPAERLPVLELQVDARVLARWFFAQAIAAPEASELQIAGYLRGAQAAAATTQVEEWLKQRQGQTLNPTQVDALGRLHQMTYALPAQAKEVAAMDQVSRDAGQLLLALHDGQSVDPKRLPPPMRPKQILATQPTGPAQPAKNDPSPSASGAPAPRTLAQLSAEARQVAVSGSLRRQLILLADNANLLARQSSQQDEAAALLAMFTQAMDVARGLQSNTGVAPETRNKIEEQLTEGLALFSDIRTRPAGAARLDSLKQYRQMLVRLGNMQLAPETAQQFAPAFVFIQENREEGQQVLATLERFFELSTRFNQRAPVELPAHFQQPLDALIKQFKDLQGDFVTASEQLGQEGAFGTKVQDLQKTVGEMQRALDLMRSIEALPRGIATLNVYKPKPAGALEKRVGTTLTMATAEAKSPQRDAADKLLADLAALSKLTDDLASRPAANIPQQIAQAYAGGKVQAMESKWRVTIGDVASQLAAGNAADARTLAQVNTAAGLYDALTSAEALESAVQRASALQRWADWGVTGDQLRKAFSPYRDAMLAGFEGFTSEGDDHDAAARSLERWTRVQRRFEPLAGYVKRVAAYADQCASLPGVDGLATEAARLMTPLDKQPFATERFASLAIGVWSRAERWSDFAASDAAAAALADRIGKN